MPGPSRGTLTTTHDGRDMHPSWNAPPDITQAELDARPKELAGNHPPPPAVEWRGPAGPAFPRVGRPADLADALALVLEAQDALDDATAADLAAQRAFYDHDAKTERITQDGIAYLVGKPNPLSGKTPPAPHTASSAKDVVEVQDPALAAHLATRRALGAAKAAAAAQASVARNQLRTLRLVAAGFILHGRQLQQDGRYMAAAGDLQAARLLDDLRGAGGMSHMNLGGLPTRAWTEQHAADVRDDVAGMVSDTLAEDIGADITEANSERGPNDGNE
jgi:hypothetical protein